MALRPCLGLPGAPCRKPTTATRCPACDRARRNAYYGPEHRRIAATLKGQPCHWGFPGCTRVGTEADHVDPADPDSRRVSSCQSCNLRRRRI